MLLTTVPVSAIADIDNEKVDKIEEKTTTADNIGNENIGEVEKSSLETENISSDTDQSSENITEDENINEIVSSEQVVLLNENDNSDDSEGTDNWDLGLVFYDSTVNNGKTPLTSIDWDASDGGYGQGEPRVITVQINYKNTNAVTTYQPGDLKIKVDGLLKNAELATDLDGNRREYLYVKDVNITWLIGANDGTHAGYDWDYSAHYVSQYSYGGTRINIQDITFSNAVPIEEKTNFEGSIQMVYTITPKSEYPEKYEDECSHSLSTDLQATLNDNISSNTAHFEYTRTYIHLWEYNTYSARKIASKINSYDGLGNNAANYIWVKWNLGYTSPNSSEIYPYIFAQDMILKDAIPDGCIVLDEDGNKLEAEDGVYNMPVNSSWTATKNIYVGYPKSIYKDDNLSITNTVELWGRYDDKTEIEFLSQATANINLSDFEFSYSGNLYSISKVLDDGNGMYYKDIINEWDYYFSSWRIKPFAIYAGNPLTIKIGDDVLYCTNQEGDYVRLEDNEYYFSSIYWNSSSFLNGNGKKITEGKYDCELWVRHKDSNKFVLYDQFKNGHAGENMYYCYGGDGSWKFTKEDGIVGFYFLIHDMSESLKSNGTYNQLISSSIAFIKKDIPESGTLYNFDYMQVFFKDSEENLILQNEPEYNSYSNFVTKQEISQFDQDTYGVYLQRGCASKKWSNYTPPQPSASTYAEKSFNSITQDAANEEFKGSCNIQAQLQGNNIIQKNYFDEYDPSYAVQGIRILDLLPAGMELTSTKEEILKSFDTEFSYGAFYDTDGNKLSDGLSLNGSGSSSRVKENIKTQEIIITQNWNGTGRTKLEIKITFKKPIYIFRLTGYPNQKHFYFKYKYNYSISYDSFLEYGNVYTNYCYIDKLETQEKGINPYYNNKCKDDGTYDKDAMDINENANIEEEIAYKKATTTITSVVSTHQDVTKYVQTDKSNYSTGTVKASPDSEYTYKLRVRTGQNDVTNLVIYDSVEEYAQNKDGNIVPAYGTKKHWNGEFLGVDTSYAEKKGYKVKVYYSEDKQAGNLSEDNSWKEYSDAVDKTSVKSLAFEYLDENGNLAIVPLGSMTYVLVKMKAPSEENRKILAYNGCRTQWNAIDQFDNPVDFITGINSNIVKVSLSDYYDLTVNKVWNDENNKWGLRPDSVDIILKKDGTEVERKQITKDNLSVTFTDFLVEDSDRYAIEEESLSLYSSAIEYNELEDCYEVTNTLKDDIFKDISGTKTWVGDKGSNRPESITIKLLRDGEVYRTTTTNKEKEWKYSFEKVPIYNADETRCIYSVEEVPVDRYTTQYSGGESGLAIKFNSKFKTESVNYDYVEIYYKQDGQTYKLGKWGGTTLAGQTVNVPTNDFYLYWRTDGSNCGHYGFSIDSIESAEVCATGSAGVQLPNYTMTELTGTNYPESPNHGNYGNNVNMLWHYTGEPVPGFDIINTYEGVDAINLSFVKEVEGTEEAFEKLQLKKDDFYNFQISMKNRETGNIISVPIDNKNTVIVNEVPVGTYVITEKDDMYFDFVSMEALNSVEGVTFEKVGNESDSSKASAYVLNITSAASDEKTLQIKVNNKIESDRPYEDKEEKENLFQTHKKDRPENPETSETTSTSETSTTTTGTSTTTGTGTTSGSTTGSSTGTGGFCTMTYISGIGWTTTCYGRNSNNNEEIYSPEVPHDK